MSEFSGIPPIWDRNDLNALLDHGLEKPPTYTVRKNGSDFEAIKGSGASGAGMITFGGTHDAGGIDGAKLGLVIQACVDASSAGEVILLKESIANSILETTITLSVDGIKLISRHVAIDVRTNGPAIDITAKDVQLIGIYLDGANQVAGRIVQVVTADSYRNIFIDCTLINNEDGDGLYLYLTWGNRVYRCNIGANNIGVHIKNSQTNTIFNNFIESNVSYGVYIEGTLGENKIIFNFMESNNDGIVCTYNKNLIMGNELNGETRYGINISGDLNRVIGNTFTGGGNLAIVSSGDNNIFADNIINQATTMSIGGTGNIVRDNWGYITENTVLSPQFAIDAVAVVAVVIPHGLDITPAAKDCQLTIMEDTNVDDWEEGFVKVETTDAANVYCKVNVTNASVTGGAKARLALHVTKVYFA